MKARFFKSSAVQSLFKSVKDNLELYRSGTFDTLMNEPDNFFEAELELKEDILVAISCQSDNFNEVDCCIKMYQALNGISQYLARDELT